METEKTENIESIADQLEELYNNLTPYDKLFVDTYLSNGFNATQAVIENFPTYKTIGSQKVAGHKFTHKKAIKQFIDLYFKLKRETKEVKIDKLCDELEKIAFGDAKAFKDATLKVKAIDILSKYYGMQENKLDITSGGEKIKLEINYV